MVPDGEKVRRLPGREMGRPNGMALVAMGSHARAVGVCTLSVRTALRAGLGRLEARRADGRRGGGRMGRARGHRRGGEEGVRGLRRRSS